MPTSRSRRRTTDCVDDLDRLFTRLSFMPAPLLPWCLMMAAAGKAAGLALLRNKLSISTSFWPITARTRSYAARNGWPHETCRGWRQCMITGQKFSGAGYRPGCREAASAATPAGMRGRHLAELKRCGRRGMAREQHDLGDHPPAPRQTDRRPAGQAIGISVIHLLAQNHFHQAAWSRRLCQAGRAYTALAFGSRWIRRHSDMPAAARCRA